MPFTSQDIHPLARQLHTQLPYKAWPRDIGLWEEFIQVADDLRATCRQAEVEEPHATIIAEALAGLVYHWGEGSGCTRHGHRGQPPCARDVRAPPWNPHYHRINRPFDRVGDNPGGRGAIRRGLAGGLGGNFLARRENADRQPL